MVCQPPQCSGKLRVGKSLGMRTQRGGGKTIQLFCNVFFRLPRKRTGLHPNPYSSKLPPLTREFLDQVRDALTQQCADGTACRKQCELGRFRSGDPDLGGKCRRQVAPDVLQDCLLVPATIQ